MRLGSRDRSRDGLWESILVQGGNPNFASKFRFSQTKSADNNGWVINNGRLLVHWTDKDLMPIELADLIPDDSGNEQQSDCDSAADIELENLNDIIFEDDSCSKRQYMQNIFIFWFNFIFLLTNTPVFATVL